ncbi:MAG: hypothetical protein ACR2LX_15545 [Jatrophihabitans sp.]
MIDAGARAQWTLVTIHAVRGLTDVGFTADSRNLLVLGRDGRGLIDTGTGVRSARDHDDRFDWFDPPSRHALGIGSFDRAWIPVAGVGGGSLQTATRDGWRAARTADGALLEADGHLPVAVTDADELRAWGFSPDDRAFVLATSTGVMILRRNPRPRAAG